jgi:DNA (cytosine-5)-methyltransferase 1
VSRLRFARIDAFIVWLGNFHYAAWVGDAQPNTGYDSDVLFRQGGPMAVRDLGRALTVKDVASALNVHERTIYRLAVAGALPSFRVAGSWRFLESDIASWIETQKRQTGSQLELALPRYKIVSLFSGCGGMDLGFLGGFSFLGVDYPARPFEIVWANDLNASACRTYAANIGPHIVAGNIWELIDQIPTTAEVVIGGFPCQDISINNAHGKGIAGARSGLYRAMVRVVERVQPKVFVAENVGGLLHRRNEESLRQVLSDFSALGYSLSYKLYHAADYGVPQTRDRVMIVGTQQGLVGFEPPEATRDKSNYISALEAIDDLADVPEDDAFSHVWSRAQVSGEQGNRRLIASRPGYTIRAEHHGNTQFHYRLRRRISTREAARIQSFPDTFAFHARLRETERQIGNAVPPVLAWHVAGAVLKYLKASQAVPSDGAHRLGDPQRASPTDASHAHTRRPLPTSGQDALL